MKSHMMRKIAIEVPMIESHVMSGWLRISNNI